MNSQGIMSKPAHYFPLLQLTCLYGLLLQSTIIHSRSGIPILPQDPIHTYHGESKKSTTSPHTYPFHRTKKQCPLIRGQYYHKYPLHFTYTCLLNPIHHLFNTSGGINSMRSLLISRFKFLQDKPPLGVP